MSNLLIKRYKEGAVFTVLVCFSVCKFIWYRMHLQWSQLTNLMFEIYKTILLQFKLLFYIEGTLMQIWKSPTGFVFIWKQYPENFTFLFLRIVKLFACEVCKFLKKYANLYLILFFVQLFTYLTCAISKRGRCFHLKSPTHYFHVKTKVLVDFEIWIKL